MNTEHKTRQSDDQLVKVAGRGGGGHSFAQIECDYLPGREDVRHSQVGVTGGGSSDARPANSAGTCPAALDPAPCRWLPGAGRGVPNGRGTTPGISYSGPAGWVVDDGGCSGSKASC